jgi:hypothetical protein
MDCQIYNVGVTSAFEKAYAKCLRNSVWFFILAAYLRLGTSKKKKITLHFHGSLFFLHNGIMKHEDSIFLVRNPLHFCRVSCSFF